MYHSISEKLDANLSPYFRTVTSPTVFEAQMVFLKQAGYRTLSLSAAVARLEDLSISSSSNSAVRRCGRDEARYVAITFDDGFRDFYTTAFPILRRHDFDATVFVSTAYIGKAFKTGRQCLSPEEIEHLATLSVAFGSHTVTHPKLRSMSRAQITRELSDSKERISKITGRDVTLFSYPYAFPEHDRRFATELGSLLTQLGYRAGVTTSVGVERIFRNRLFMRRLPINDCDTSDLFAAKLAGAYDWVRLGQLAHKKFRDSIKPTRTLD